MQNKQQSPVILRIKQKLRENIKAFIIILILQILGLPLISVITPVFYYRAATIPDAYIYDHPDIYISISVISVILAVLSGIIIVLRNFSYLYKKTEVDMNLSLPLTSSQRFLSDFFSGLAVYIIPYVIAVILSMISLGIGNSVYPEFYNENLEGISLIHCVICILLVMIMLYTLTALVTVCCGNMFETFVYTILINGIIPVFFYIANFIIFSVRSNDKTVLHIETLGVVMTTSPFGGVLKLAEYTNVLPEITTHSHVFEATDNIWFVRYSIVIIIFFFSTFFLYNRRKAEDVSKPFVFSFIYYSFAFALTVCISGMLFWSRQYVNAIVISAVIFAVLEIIRNRGLKHVVKAGLYFASTIAVSFAFVKLSIQTDGFGQIYKTPDASDVKAVSLIYHGFYNEQWRDYKPIVFTDQKDIKRILKMQSESLSYFKDNRNEDNNYKYIYGNESQYSYAAKTDRFYPAYDNFEIAYIMKNGNLIYRSYLVPYNTMAENLISLSLSQEYKDYLVDNITEKYEYYYDSTEKTDITYVKDKMRFNETKNADSDYVNDLTQAYRKDIEAQTEDDIKNFDLYCTINGKYIGTSFKNTLNFLEKYNIGSSLESVSESYPPDKVLIADSNHIIENNIISTNIITESCGTPSQYYTTNFDSDLLNKISQIAKSHYYTDKHCYVMLFDGPSGYTNYVIPPEYSDLVEEFMAKSELNDLVWTTITDQTD